MDTLNDFLLSLTGDSARIVDLILRLTINTVFCFIIARGLYFPKSRRNDFFFTYLLMGFAIFMLIHLMGDSKIKTGIAMGLFAIFSIMRYRTESVPIREMTYLFLTIAMATINGVAWEANISGKHPDFLGPELVSAGELILTDLLFVLAIWIVERVNFARGLSSKFIRYDKIDLITPERHDELIEDLKKRTGLDITKVSIGSIDFLKDMALLKIFYNDNDSEHGEENLDKLPKMFQ